MDMPHPFLSLPSQLALALCLLVTINISRRLWSACHSSIPLSSLFPHRWRLFKGATLSSENDLSCKSRSLVIGSESHSGFCVATVTKPLLLTRMEATSDAVTTRFARAQKISAITGLRDAGRLTEVMADAIIPISTKLLTPNAMASSGLIANYNAHLESSLTDAFPGNVDISQTSPIRLSDFAGRHTFRAISASLFGPTFPSDCFSDYAAAIHQLPNHTSGSSFMNRRGQGPREQLMAIMRAYIEEWWYADGHDRIEGISSLVERFLFTMKEEELGVDEAAGGLLCFLVDAHTNLWTTTFCLLHQVVSNSSTYREMAEEARVTSEYPEDAPLLDSVVNETLRWMRGPRPERHLERDAEFVIDGERYIIRGGTKLLLDMRNAHFDEEIYPEPSEFEPVRFMGDSLPLPKAFGEGKRMCKGAHLALLQIKSFVGYVVSKYELEKVASGEDDSLRRRPSFGVDSQRFGPAFGGSDSADFLVRVGIHS